MKNIARACRRLGAEESGLASIEYAFVTSLIAIVCVLTVVSAGESANALYTRVCNKVTQAISGAPAC